MVDKVHGVVYILVEISVASEIEITSPADHCGRRGHVSNICLRDDYSKDIPALSCSSCVRHVITAVSDSQFEIYCGIDPCALHSTLRAQPPPTQLLQLWPQRWRPFPLPSHRLFLPGRPPWLVLPALPPRLVLPALPPRLAFPFNLLPTATTGVIPSPTSATGTAG